MFKSKKLKYSLYYSSFNLFLNIVLKTKTQFCLLLNLIFTPYELKIIMIKFFSTKNFLFNNLINLIYFFKTLNIRKKKWE